MLDLALVHVVDLSHNDSPDFGALKAAGVVGVILKASQGSTYSDPKFQAFYGRAIAVFGHGLVHSYHFLDNSNATTQIAHYLDVTAGKPGRWLDYEPNPSGETCSLQTAISACHQLSIKQGRVAGMYGSDGDLLGDALTSRHFDPCFLWLANYSHKPKHKCDLWQFAAGEGSAPVIGGAKYDVSTFVGSASDCATFMRQVAGIG